MKKLFLVSILLTAKLAFGQTWVSCLSTDTTNIYNVFQGKEGGIAVYAEYRCDSCTTKDAWMIAETQDNGNSWKPLTYGKVDHVNSNNFYLLETYFFNKDTGVAIGNFVYRTVNGGKTWTSLQDIDTTSMLGGGRLIYKLTPTSAISLNNNIVKFTNYGFSNKIVLKDAFGPDGGIQGFAQRNALCVKGNHIYFLRPQLINGKYVPNKSTLNIFNSSDLGEKWSIIKTSIKCNTTYGSNFCIAMQSETEGMISIPGVSNGSKLVDGLFKFKNDSIYYNDTIMIDSAPWHDYLRIIGLHFYNNCEGVLATYQPYHYKTIDGGATWIKTDIAIGYNNKEASFFDSTCVLFNGGYDFNIQKTVLDVSYNRAGPPYPNGTNTTCVINTTGFQDKTSFKRIQVLPNPFNNSISVILNDDNYENTLISLYDNTGKQILTQRGTQKEERLTTNALAPGLYIISVSSKNNTQYFKLIKY